MSAKYKSPSFLLPNELNTNTNPLNTDGDPATGTGVNSLYSMNFDGNSSASYIDLGVITELDGLTNFSFSIWFTKPTQESGDNIVFGNRDTSNSSRGIALSLVNGLNSYLYFVGPGGGAVWNEIPNSLLNTGWNHIVTTYDGTTLKSVVNNGTPITDLSSRTLVSTTNFRLGNDGTLNSGYYSKGKLDEFCIFNKTISDQDITALWNGGSPASAATVLNLDPFAYYPLGEQAQNTGKLPEATANVWQFPNGVLQDYVMDFDGATVGDYIDAGDIPLEGVYTISFWINPDASPSSLYFLLDKGDGSSNISARVTQSSNNTIRFQIGSSNFSSTDTLTNNSWNNVILIANGSSSKIYINNGTAATGTLTTAPNTAQSLLIGTDEGKQSTYYFNGQMSNVVVWNTDQSANVANIYNNGSPQTTYTVAPQNWWKLNADSVYTPSAPNYTTALGFNNPKTNYDEVAVGDLTTLAIPSNDITISLWAKLRTITNPQDKYGMIYSDKSGYIYFSLSGGLIKYESNLRGTTSLKDTTGIAPSELLKWHHIVVTFSGTEAKLYYNSQLLDTGTAGSATNFGEDTIIGNWRNNIGNASYSFGGLISNITVFQSALSASQISTLFNFGTPETNTSFSPIHKWKLDNLTAGLNDTGSLASNNGTARAFSGSGPVQESTSVAVVPSWKIPSALPITSTANYTTALDFNVSDKISLGSSVDLGINSSISLWINMPNTPGTYITLGEDSYIADYLMYIHSTYIYISIGNVYKTYTHSFNTNEWYNIVIVRQGDSIEVFKNNTSLGTQTGFGTSVTTKIDTIGAKTSGNNPFIGSMSNVAVYNSALTNSQVSTLYNSGTPETAISFSPVSWWKLDTGGSTIIDYGSGGNNGTNNGATQVTSDVLTTQPVNGVSTTLPSTALQQSDLQFDSPYSNYSLSFDGNSYIDTNFTLPASYASFSYSFWFKRTTSANPADTEYLIGNGISPGNNNQFRGGVKFRSYGGVVNLSIFGGDNTSTDYNVFPFVNATSILDQQWHHISITFVSGEIKTFFDGALVNTYTNSLVVTGYAANRSYVLGDNGLGTGYLVNSMLDEFAIFNKKLTEAEILSIYNSGKPGDISTTAPTNWWRLGENAYFVNNDITLPNSISGAPNGVSSGTATSMLTADAPGTYANGVGTNLDIVDRVGDAALSVANSQSYNMIPDDKIPYVPGYVGLQTTNAFEMAFDGVDDYFDTFYAPDSSLANGFSISAYVKASSIDTSGNAGNTIIGTYDFTNTSGSGGQNRARFFVNIQLNSGAYEFFVGFGSYYASLEISNFTLNQWNYVAVTYDGSTLKLYCKNPNTNTSSQHTVSLSSIGLLPPLGNYDAHLYIGATNRFNSTQSVDQHWNGNIDEVAIFDKALTADQVQFDLYEPSLPLSSNKTADIANNPNLPTPVAWYRMGD